MNKSQWIDVNERLPDIDIRVLCLMPDNSDPHVIGKRHTYRGKEMWYFSIKYGYKVTHWMPLPQPPEQKD